MVNRPQQQNPTVWERNQAVCRTYLEGVKSVRPEQPPLFPAVSFFRVRGLTSFWEAQGDGAASAAMADLVAGQSGENAVLAYVLLGTGAGIELYMGTDESAAAGLQSALTGGFPQIHLVPVRRDEVTVALKGAVRTGGIVTGYPTRKLEREKPVPQLDRVCRGLLGEMWAYVVLAWSLSPRAVAGAYYRLLEHQSDVSPNATHSAALGETVTQQVTNFVVKDYQENLTALAAKMAACFRRGAWSSCAYYGAADTAAAGRLANLIRAAYSGDDSKPDPIRCLALDDRVAPTVIGDLMLTVEQLPVPQNHPIGAWGQQRDGYSCRFLQYAYQTVMASDDLATMVPMLRQEFPGYYVNRFVEFDVDIRHEPAGSTISLGRVALDPTRRSDQYRLALADLTRHGLIAGVTGSGKTNTAKQMLRQLGQRKIPFLVIESAKQEYWELANLDGLAGCRVLSPGGQERVPYRVNPFEPVDRARLQTHVDCLLATFKASFDLFPPLPHLLETCVYEVYEDHGWDVLTSQNRLGRVDYPMVSDLVNKVDVVLDRLAYDDRVRSDLSAALRARLGSLLTGNKEYVLNTRSSIPISWVLEGPTVLELDDIADDDVKSFITGLLLVQLYEYRKQHGGSHDRLVHLLLIEEAHRLLRHVPEGAGESASPRGRAVEFFCNLLAEVRSYGQAILIADQIPTKLASDTLRNTNLKVAHRIVEQGDRETVGRTMNMTPEQIEYLSTLPRGMAAVYAEGDHRPKLVEVDEVKPAGGRSRETVLTQTACAMPQKWRAPFPGQGPACTFCLDWCAHYQKVAEFFANPNNQKDLTANLQEIQSENWSPEAIARVLLEIRAARENHGLLLCLLNEFLRLDPMPSGHKREKVVAFLKQQGRPN